jgi:hypothetical protein
MESYRPKLGHRFIREDQLRTKQVLGPDLQVDYEKRESDEHRGANSCTWTWVHSKGQQSKK